MLAPSHSNGGRGEKRSKTKEMTKIVRNIDSKESNNTGSTKIRKAALEDQKFSNIQTSSASRIAEGNTAVKQ